MFAFSLTLQEWRTDITVTGTKEHRRSTHSHGRILHRAGDGRGGAFRITHVNVLRIRYHKTPYKRFQLESTLGQAGGRSRDNVWASPVGVYVRSCHAVPSVWESGRRLERMAVGSRELRAKEWRCLDLLTVWDTGERCLIR